MAETLVIGQRFLLIVLPLFLLAYGHFLWALLQKLRWEKHVPVVIGSIAVILLSVVGVIHKKHQAHLNELIADREEILSKTRPDDTLVCDADIGKFFLPFWGMRDFKNYSNMYPENDRRLMREAWETRKSRLVYVSKTDTLADGSPVAPVAVFKLRPLSSKPSPGGLHFQEVIGLKTAP
jgi:hypothetical protein